MKYLLLNLGTLSYSIQDEKGKTLQTLDYLEGRFQWENYCNHEPQSSLNDNGELIEVYWKFKN